MSIGLAQSKKVFFTLFLVSIPFILAAQIVQSGRLELKMNYGDSEKYKCVGLGPNGLLIYRRLTARKTDQIELIKMDTILKENWKDSFTIDKDLNLMRVHHNTESVFLLFKDWTHIGGDFLIISVNQSSGESLSYTVKNFIPFNPTEFHITSKAALIGGYYNYRPVVLHYSFALQKTKVFPGFFNELGELDQVKSYEDGSFDVIVCARNFEKRKSLWIRNYDALGDLIKTTVLQPDEDKNLIFGRSVKLASGEQIVAGVYGRFSDYSRGIFVAGINPVGEYAIVYYNFGQLQNFFSYMKAKRQKRVKDRIERKTLRGKKVKFSYRFLIHDIIPFQGRYIMAGEAFYPHYSTPNNQYFPGYNVYNAYPLSRQNSYFHPRLRDDLIFDGYQYTHAVVIGFDKDGKLSWDNSFEINDVRTMQLEQFVEIKPAKDKIILMYLFDNTLRTKIIKDAAVLEGKNQDPVKTDFIGDTDESKEVENEQLDFWYGDYFFAYGVQKIVNSAGAQRRVFFVNKITYK